MPNEFQSTDSGAANLKTVYDEGEIGTSMREALKKRRKKLRDQEVNPDLEKMLGGQDES